MSELLVQNQLLLIFLVAALGYLVGNISIKGNKLGLAAVLFVGLGFGAVNTNLQVDSIIFELGLVLFVYSIGLSSGPVFFKSFKRNGPRDFFFIILMLTLSAGLALLVFFIFSFSTELVVGLYTGSTTNTPALASVIDLINNTNIGEQAKSASSQELVVGYAFSYPMGVIGVMLSIILVEKMLKINYDKETNSVRKTYSLKQDITSIAVRVTQPEAIGKTLRQIYNHDNWAVVFGRYKKKADIFLPNWNTVLEIGDEFMVVGTQEDLDKIINTLGEKGDELLTYDRTEYDVRRIFLSNQELVGKEIGSLNIQEKFNAIITRVRRGDMDMIASSDLILEEGDRIRFVANREDLGKLSTYLGDSYYSISRMNVFSFGIGIALGLLLGMIEFTLPGGLKLKLGFAGGPLIVGLILGSLRRTGQLIWSVPYGVNVTLRQIGLTLLLAIIGLKSGGTFINALTSASAISIFIGGTIISMITTIISLLVGYKLFKIPFSLLLGFVSNQPAILDFVTGKSSNGLPILGYTMMFPIAMILKIIYAQLLYLFLV